LKIGDIAGVLPEDDERLFRENISLLEDMVAANARGAASPPILAAIRAVPRHLFVAPDYRALAYTDSALPTARGLTTSAPSVIALMIHESGVRPGHRVLEVGTGTGYQAAVLSEMGAAVYSIEVDGALASAANEILVRLGYKQHASSRPGPGTNGELHRHHAPRCLLPSRGDVRLYHGNGLQGCREGAPYDAIILAAAVPSLEHLETLARQLRPGGRLVAPVGGHHVQQLMRLERTRNRIHGGPVEGISLDFVGMVLPQKKA
jgi:protein-L-isoaspartate(D-aspartate) O-methyltransferase